MSGTDRPPDVAAPAVRVRDAVAADTATLLVLNAASVHFLSPLDEARFALIRAQAACCRVATVGERVRGFVLAFAEGSAYDSLNYRWFAERYPRFVYVDRVVVDEGARGLGLGVRLYDDLCAFARARGASHLTCEYYVAPPNEGSARFHARYGFAEVGTQALAGDKRVSLQALPLAGA